MTAPYRRTTQTTAFQDHQRRIRAIEGAANGPWQYVGAAYQPPFENGWVNSGGGLTNMRFRSLMGGGFEVQGSVIGGTPGTAVFTLPERFWPDNEIRATASDDNGDFVVFRVTPAGECIFGL